MQELEEYYRSFSAEQLKQKIEDLRFEIQANGEMSESAHYYRDEVVMLGDHEYRPNQFLADWEDYEHEVEQCQEHLEIAEKIYWEKINAATD